MLASGFQFSVFWRILNRHTHRLWVANDGHLIQDLPLLCHLAVHFHQTMSTPVTTMPPSAVTAPQRDALAYADFYDTIPCLGLGICSAGLYVSHPHMLCSVLTYAAVQNTRMLRLCNREL